MIDFFIQVAGVHDRVEAEMLADCGVTHIGLPLGPGVREQDLNQNAAREILCTLPRSVCGVLITYLATAREISGFAGDVGAGWVQVHGEITLGEISLLRQKRPELKVIKSLIVGKRDGSAIFDECRNFAPYCDYFLADTFDADTGACGATGKVHDWEISRDLARFSARPVILAGGLNADNVYRAVSEVEPAGVDAHTGLENSRGRKDPELVLGFVREALRAREDSGRYF